MVKMQVKGSSSTRNVANKDDLIVKRKGGGSITDHRPVFSHDGELLYVVWKQTIRAYSSQTGDFVRELESCGHKLIGISLNPAKVNTVIGCTDNGALVFWNCQSGIVTHTVKLAMDEKVNSKIKTFHIVHHKSYKDSKRYQALITAYTGSSENAKGRVRILLFGLGNGKLLKFSKLVTSSEEYFVDVIGNHGDNLIAISHNVDLHILSPKDQFADKLHKTGATGRIQTCIAGHPEEECVATGDSTGRVVVWKNILSQKPTQSVFHWHTLPVTEIVFSKSGGHMYSGGGECVLVKWNLSNSHDKSFLPRLPAPIKHLTIAPDNLYVAVSTLDNGILVVNPQKKLTSVIQNFTWGVATSSKDFFPAGLIVDPRTNSLVLNSRTGHVQFYDTFRKKLLYNINITAQNFLTQERTAIIVNTEVTRIALNAEGTWLATVEERDDKLSNVEIRLKFWCYNFDKQIFSLNTSIELPHEIGVNALKFQPSIPFADDKIQPFVVTTGRDKKFKLWSLEDATSIYDKTKHWMCYSIGSYRNLDPTDAAFSMDSSLLGIAFDSSLTIWVPETGVTKCSLTHSRHPQRIMRVEFGKYEACHLVVVASKEHVAVWNLLSLNIIWTVPLKVSTISADPNSSFMAVFTTNNTLVVFTPQNSTPVYVKKQLLEADNSILASCFVPNVNENSNNPGKKKWQEKSQLYFLDSDRELLTLETESEIGGILENLAINENQLPLKSPFNQFMDVAEIKIGAKEGNRSQVHEQFGISGKGILQELLGVSAHTLPPMSMLCAPYIISLTAKSLPKSRKEDKVHSKNDDSRDSENDSSDDENDALRNRNSSLLVKKIPDDEPIEEDDEDSQEQTNLKLSEHKWDFLTSVLPQQL